MNNSKKVGKFWSCAEIEGQVSSLKGWLQLFMK